MMMAKTYISSLFLTFCLLFFSVQASPLQWFKPKRSVGLLNCYTTKIGKLVLYNTKTKQTQFATFKNNYTLTEELQGKQVPDYAHYWQNFPLLSSFNNLTSQMVEKFEFLQCDESQQPGFENFPPEDKNGTFYGHLSPIPANKPLTSENPPRCATYRQLYGDTAFLTAEKCYYSDDSGSVLSYFSYSPSLQGQIDFLGYTGPQGQEPETQDQKDGEYDFIPGKNAKSPAVNVHGGSKQFSEWVLRLE